MCGSVQFHLRVSGSVHLLPLDGTVWTEKTQQQVVVVAVVGYVVVQLV
jgi:hypothetical protein